MVRKNYDDAIVLSICSIPSSRNLGGYHGLVNIPCPTPDFEYGGDGVFSNPTQPSSLVTVALFNTRPQNDISKVGLLLQESIGVRLNQ